VFWCLKNILSARGRNERNTFLSSKKRKEGRKAFYVRTGGKEEEINVIPITRRERLLFPLWRLLRDNREGWVSGRYGLHRSSVDSENRMGNMHSGEQMVGRRGCEQFQQNIVRKKKNPRRQEGRGSLIPYHLRRGGGGGSDIIPSPRESLKVPSLTRLVNRRGKVPQEEDHPFILSGGGK